MKKERMISCIILIFIDQLVKFLITNNITLNNEVFIIPKFFYLTNVLNTGGAFSILSGNVPIIIILSLFVIYFLINIIKKNNYNNFELVCYSLLVGGAVGNLFDRVVYGYVVDFLDFNILGYDYPVFNFADTFIIIIVILLFINSFKKEGDSK